MSIFLKNSEKFRFSRVDYEDFIAVKITLKIFINKKCLLIDENTQFHSDFQYLPIFHFYLVYAGVYCKYSTPLCLYTSNPIKPHFFYFFLYVYFFLHME